MKKRIIWISLSVLLLLSGVLLLLYPLISNYLYEREQQQLFDYYENLEEEMPVDERKQELERCRAYNAKLTGQQSEWKDPFSPDQGTDFDYATYDSLLNLDKNGIMGALEIPALQVSMMIYHGVDDSTMQAGAGHMPQSSAGGRERDACRAVLTFRSGSEETVYGFGSAGGRRYLLSSCVGRNPRLSGRQDSDGLADRNRGSRH